MREPADDTPPIVLLRFDYPNQLNERVRYKRTASHRFSIDDETYP